MSILLVDSIRLGNKVKKDTMCAGEKIYHRGWDKKEQKLYCYEVDEKGNRID